jgi:hypothetical protein
MPSTGDDSIVRIIEASALAGLVTRSLLHPIDTCKTVIQISTESGGSRSMVKSAISIYKSQGVKGLYRGFSPAIAGTIPGAALYFTSFHLFKNRIESRYPTSPHLTNFCSGFLAEVVSCIVWVPTDVLKERAQANARAGSPLKPAVFTLRSIISTEGIRGLYRGYGATLASFGPFSAFYFMFVEQFKAWTKSLVRRDDLKFHELVPVCAAAGGSAAFLSAPLDLVKVRMQVERSSNSSYPGFVSALRRVYRSAGLRGLFRGGGSRVWFAVPNTAITMSLMESIRHRLE